MAQIVEYRGVEGLVYAPVTQDDSAGFACGTVKPLAGVAEISKTVNSSEEAHYYDNIPAIIISSEGTDEITINTSAIPLDVLAEITGQYFDAETGMLVEQERTPQYFALGYMTEDTSGNSYLCWRMKGRFAIPDTTSQSRNDGTDANGQELTFTGINTTHKFSKTGKSAKGVTVNDGLGLADTTGFFTSVQTPDTVQPKTATPSVSLSASALSIEEGNSATIIATTVPADAPITWTSSAEAVATVTDGTVAALTTGTTTITAKITVGDEDYSATCTVSVTEATT